VPVGAQELIPGGLAALCDVSAIGVADVFRHAHFELSRKEQAGSRQARDPVQRPGACHENVSGAGRPREHAVVRGPFRVPQGIVQDEARWRGALHAIQPDSRIGQGLQGRLQFVR